MEEGIREWIKNIQTREKKVTKQLKKQDGQI